MRDSATPTPLERNLASAAARAEFEVPRVQAWLADLRRQGLGLALPSLILKLDALNKVDLPPIQRVELLRLFKKPVLKALASLPKPVVAASDFVQSAASGVTLEQRLLRVMQSNLQLALYHLFKFEWDAGTAGDEARSWAIRNLYDFTERQIRYGIDWKVPWPPGTWQDLHDLYVLLSTRGPMHVLDPTEFDARGPGHGPALKRTIDAAVAYKRLLLLGLAGQFKPSCCDDPVLLKNLDAWAAESRLDPPERRVWDVGVYMVEVAQDAPPRHRPGVLEDSFHGWVLEPPQDFLAYIGRALAPEVPDFHPFDGRRVAGRA
jgi:hypothetical protein